MPGLPVVSGREAARASQRDGAFVRRRIGSHPVLEKSGMEPTPLVPLHGKLAAGTLRALIRAAGLVVDDFRGLL